MNELPSATGPGLPREAPPSAGGMLPAMPSMSSMPQSPAPAQHWRLAMERAQLATWFPQAPAHAANSGMPDARPSTTAEPARGLPRAFGRGGPTEAGRATATPMPAPALDARAGARIGRPAATAPAASDSMSRAAAQSGTGPARWLFQAAPRPAPRAVLPAAGYAPAAAAPQTAAVPALRHEDTSALPLRAAPAAVNGSGGGHALPPWQLHAEDSPQGRRIWIALRGDAATQAALLPVLLHELLADAAARGLRTHRVVCNGRPVWPPPDAPPASPRAGSATPAPESPSSTSTSLLKADAHGH